MKAEICLSMLNFLQHNLSISFQLFLLPMTTWNNNFQEFYLCLAPYLLLPFTSSQYPGFKCDYFWSFSNLQLISMLFTAISCFCASLWWSQQQVCFSWWLCMWGDQPIFEKIHPQKPVLKSFWLNSADYFQKLSQQLSEYFVASLDAVDKADSVISCNGFYLPEQTEALMRISIFVSVSPDLISVIPSVILTTVFQHLHKVALKLFVIL